MSATIPQMPEKAEDRHPEAVASSEPKSLESLLGDPNEPGPLSYRAVLTADDARELPTAAEELLRDWGAGAEFVPDRLGGRWRSTRDLVDRLVPVFRRDPALGLGFGFTSLMAGVVVWLAGSARQQEDVARVLLDGGQVSIAFHELAHGNDLTHNECRLDLDAGGYRLRGSKETINNLHRADRAVVMARSSSEDGPRSHTLALWDVHSFPGELRGRYRTSGMRGVRLTGVDLDVELSTDDLLGGTGAATETALRAFQVTRSVLPAVAVGSLDAALHLAADYATGRALYGTTVAHLPQSRRLLAVSYADLLLADALAGCAVRALHVSPEDGFVLSAACKYLVPELIQDGLGELASLFGSTFYGRVAPYGAIEKFVRDLAVLPVGHAGGTSCLMSLLPLLPRWARSGPRAAVADLFTDSAVRGAPELHRLRLSVGGRDALTGVFTDPDVREAIAAEAPSVLALFDLHVMAVTDLEQSVRAAPRSAFVALADAATFDVARRFTLLLAAASAVGTWFLAREHAGLDSPGGPGAAPGLCVDSLRLALHRSAALLRLSDPDPTVPMCDHATATILERRSAHRSLRITAESVFIPRSS